MSSQSAPYAATLPRSSALDQVARVEPAMAGVKNAAVFEEARRMVDGSAHVPLLPAYLQQTYWWAYLHPNAVWVFERQWLVNLILWGNFAELRDAALAEMGETIDGTVLQVACVYGDFTERLAQRLTPNGRLDVVDVAPVQLENLKTKLNGAAQIVVYHQDSTDLRFVDASYDCVVVFFLLHEQPEATRIQTIAQALRVVKPGGKVVFVDYHRPDAINPFRYVMVPIFKSLEPFAMDLWNKEIADWLPTSVRLASIDKQTFFGGLYQKVVMIR
ncbi:MAG: rhodoquinone biosynthesis methyltransferase RquA [Candidatus Competibacteraceae bacterium]